MSSVPRFGDAVPIQKKTQGQRRTWNPLEESHLIHLLKDLITSGWKADNSFRPGYLQTLEGALKARLLSSNISSKHINSKLTVWKKTYYQLVGMQGTSGFGWNDSSRTIEVDDEVWALYVKAHPDVANMRFKSYIYYDDWVEIFGKDRANGDAAEDFVDVVEDLLKSPPVNNANPKGKEPVRDANNDDMLNRSPTVDLRTDFSDGPDFVEELTPYNMGYHTKSKLTKKGTKEKIKKEKQTRKRKTPESYMSEHLKPDMEELMKAAKSTWVDLSSKFGKEEDTYDDNAKKIIAALDSISSLTDENRNYLSFKIMDNSKHISLFLNSSERNREMQAHMVLDGKMP